MEKLKLYYIKEEYIDYLRKYDDKILYNKKGARPYVGVVLKFNNFEYFAPLSSPKRKHIAMNSSMLDIFKIDDGKLGIVNINNMIPTPALCLQEVLPTLDDLTYKNLLEKQISYINRYRDKLLTKVSKFYKLYNSNYLSLAIMKRTCNFLLLEKKCLEYMNKSVAV